MNTFAGFDTTDSVQGLCATIKSAGYGWICKYALRSDAYPNKAWTAEEIAEAHAAGLKCSIIFETGNTLDHFTAANGASDGATIAAVMEQLGFPKGIGLAAFAAYDLDLTKEQIMDTVRPYAQKFRAAVEDAYLPGAYLNGLGLTLLGPRGTGEVHYPWLPQASGWGGYDEYLATGDWDIHQLLNSPLKLSADGDTARTTAFAW